jgi:hypothetical protein
MQRKLSLKAHGEKWDSHQSLMYAEDYTVGGRVRVRSEMEASKLRLFGLWSQVFHDCVDIRKPQKAVSQMLDGRVGDRCRSSLRYSYNAGKTGLVGKECY